MRSASLAPVLAVALVWTGGCREERVPPPETGFLDVGGARLYYEQMGKGDPVVLLHGGLLDCRMWDPQFEVLAGSYRVIRYDARNHGRSEGVPGVFTQSDDLAELLDRLDIPRAAFVGLSLGGRTLLDFAIAHPDRVSALVLASPGAGGYRFTSAAYRENSERMREAFRQGDLPGGVEYFQRSWTDGPSRAPADVDAEVREKVRSMALATVQNWNSDSVSNDLEPPAIGRLAEIRAPTLVVVGDLDMPGILEIAHAIETEVPGAELVVLPGAAHMVNLEQPERFNEVVSEFLARTLR